MEMLTVKQEVKELKLQWVFLNLTRSPWYIRGLLDFCLHAFCNLAAGSWCDTITLAKIETQANTIKLANTTQGNTITQTNTKTQANTITYTG